MKDENTVDESELSDVEVRKALKAMGVASRLGALPMSVAAYAINRNARGLRYANRWELRELIHNNQLRLSVVWIHVDAKYKAQSYQPFITDSVLADEEIEFYVARTKIHRPRSVEDGGEGEAGHLRAQLDSTRIVLGGALHELETLRKTVTAAHHQANVSLETKRAAELPVVVQRTSLRGRCYVSTVFDPANRCFETAVFVDDQPAPLTGYRSFDLLSAADQHRQAVEKSGILDPAAESVMARG